MESGLVGGECEGCVIEKLRINVYTFVQFVVLINSTFGNSSSV